MLFKLVGGVLLGCGLVFLLDVGSFPRRYHARASRRHAAAVRAWTARGASGRGPTLLSTGAWPFAGVRYGLGAVLVAVGIGVLTVAAAR